MSDQQPERGRDHLGRFIKPVDGRDPRSEQVAQQAYETLLAEYPAHAESAAFRLVASEIAKTYRLLFEYDAALDQLGGPVTAQGRLRPVAIAREKAAGRLARLLKQLPRGARR